MDKKILIVDDAMFMRNIIRKILKEDGYTQVWEAQDGEHAMEPVSYTHLDVYKRQVFI